MNFSKILSVGFLVLGFIASAPLEAAHERHDRDPETEIVLESERLLADWFGDNYILPLDHDGIHANWVIVKAESVQMFKLMRSQWSF